MAIRPHDCRPHPCRPLPEIGIGLRAAHVQPVLASPPAVDWLEVHAENYMADRAALDDLVAVRALRPVALHGVGLSLGGAALPDPDHLRRLRGLVRRIEPAIVSEHLAWCMAGGAYLNDLLPLPYTEESLAVVADNVDAAQSRLGRRILIENPSAYLRFSHSTLAESDFLAALVARTGCGILCDVNNLHVRARNLGEDPVAALDALPAGAVGEIHVAGHSASACGDRTVLIDDHGGPVSPPVWTLYRRALRRFGSLPTLLEWDTRLPALPILVAEAAKVRGQALAALREAGRDLAA
ncbi:MAG: DUF692 domain-containing protein [Alphaproteobacteria bacterium]